MQAVPPPSFNKLYEEFQVKPSTKIDEASQDLFNLIDTNHDGVVSPEEFKAANKMKQMVELRVRAKENLEEACNSGKLSELIASIESLRSKAKQSRREGLRKHARTLLEEAGSCGESQLTFDSMRMSLPNQDSAVSALQEVS